ncbi:DNA polymerase III subunit psi [Oceanisphaera psychrotolerans]|uniref:DNA polymerase III subunit psi n=1 Tax=Oceanisphaera psychrotolerans TaxID=1414654 RepID=A0A1J4QEE7_9GAMM|nr:DNA polymerase III subunit psi [Oceanisphaera psychrotolerans]OIN07373.1 hypothetical protein BFR47_16570 [Oceanisphaera psychrotolerans]
MALLQSQLWQLLKLPVWHCTHPERLPHGPAPAVDTARVLLVLGSGQRLSPLLRTDLLQALSLNETQLQLMEESAWLAAGMPSAPVLLGLSLTGDTSAFSWHGALPLTPSQKRDLWGRLCSLCFDH